MKRFQMWMILGIGLAIGYIGGSAITRAYGDRPKFDPDQVVAQVGETKITRGELSDYLIEQFGTMMLDGALQDLAIAEEVGRKKGVVVTPKEVDDRIQDMLKFAESAKSRKQLEETPRSLLEARIHAVLLVEKMMGLAISDTEARLFHTENSGIFNTPALAKVTLIATDKMSQAMEAQKKLKAGQKPEDVSDQFSTNPDLKKVHGEFGWIPRTYMNKEVAAAIFDANGGQGLKPGQYTKIIENKYGEANPAGGPAVVKTEYLIFCVKEVMPAKVPKFDEVKDACFFFARAKKYLNDGPAWYLKQLKDVEWKRLKTLNDFFKPEAQLEALPIKPDKYTERISAD